MKITNKEYFMTCVGQEVRKERRTIKKSTDIIGKYIGKPPRYLNDFERGKSVKISIYRLKLIANQLDLPLHVIIKRGENRYNNINDSEILNDIDVSIEINEKHVEQLVYNVGDVLRDIRVNMGASQQDIAKKLNVTKQTYGRYELVDELQMSLYKIIGLSNVLGVSLYEIIYRAEKRLYEGLGSIK